VDGGQVVNQSDGAQEFVLTLHTLVNDPVLLEMFLQINPPAGRVVTQRTHLDGGDILDIVDEQVTVSVDLLLKLPVTHVALMDDGGPSLTAPLEEGRQVLLPLGGVFVVLPDVVDERL
jgi:hypothetical protein